MLHTFCFSLQNAVYFIMLLFWFLYSHFTYRVCKNLNVKLCCQKVKGLRRGFRYVILTNSESYDLTALELEDSPLSACLRLHVSQTLFITESLCTRLCSWLQGNSNWLQNIWSRILCWSCFASVQLSVKLVRPYFELKLYLCVPLDTVNYKCAYCFFVFVFVSASLFDDRPPKTALNACRPSHVWHVRFAVVLGSPVLPLRVGTHL
jgi:hypothetical protein